MVDEKEITLDPAFSGEIGQTTQRDSQKSIQFSSGGLLLVCNLDHRLVHTPDRQAVIISRPRISYLYWVYF